MQWLGLPITLMKDILLQHLMVKASIRGQLYGAQELRITKS